MKWSVTEVQSAEAGAGFVLYDDRRRPCVEFGYASYEAAEAAWGTTALATSLSPSASEGNLGFAAALLRLRAARV
jgi:hypothetical protein